MQSLNSAQQVAVETIDGPLLVLAGAGTGKTRVLTQRIAHIITGGFARPDQILAVTFTNKAAREMFDRVNLLVDSLGLNIGTFHSICTKILRSHIQLLGNGMNRNFTIIDQDDQIKLIKNIAAELSIDIKKFPPKLLHVIINKWKDQGLFPERISKADLRNQEAELAFSVYKLYQQRIRESNNADFGDLLMYCNQMLMEHPDVLEHYQEKFRYVLIDEYQDTNTVQYLWARMLAGKHKNICCVGDDDQSIYSWRGADVRNILRFEKDFPNATIVKLEQNYRSKAHILQAAAAIISHNLNRHEKKLWTDQACSDKVNIVSCWNDKEEARFVASMVGSYMKAGTFKASQIAILVRAGFQTRAFEEVFISNAMPYQIIGGLRFYERMEIRDLLAYIRLSLNKNDNLAFERIINVPKRSIGDATLRKIKDVALERNISAFFALELMLEDGGLKGKVGESLNEFTKLINQAAVSYQSSSAFEVTKFLLEKSGYLPFLKEQKTDESRARIENLNEMLKAVDEAGDINQFIEHASLVMDNEVMESDFGGTVKIMTLHAAKGLEFDLVFLPGWEEGIFPHQKALVEQGEKGLEEERRIAYVGITRAKKELYITYAEKRRVFAESVYSLPSRFIAEIPANICHKFSSSNQLNFLGSKHNFYFQQHNDSYPKKAVEVEVLNRSCDNLSKHLKDGAGKPGAKVSHVKFGSGIIIKRNGDILDIVFEKAGLKSIKEDYIKLL